MVNGQFNTICLVSFRIAYRDDHFLDKNKPKLHLTKIMTENNKIPPWIQANLFENVLREILPEYKQIKNFKAYNALQPGENYATVMLKIELQVQLNDESILTETLMMKIPHDSDMYREQMSKWNMFSIESLMYHDIVPELEQIYDDAGLKVKFSPQGYTLPTDREYVLLEDLKKKNFRNTNRQEGLDMEHCEMVLKKIAQWHAGSAVRIYRKGQYPKQHVQGVPNKDGFEFIQSMMEHCIGNVLKTAKGLSGHEQYYEQMEKLSKNFTQIFYDKVEVDPNDFNVINHGDCWSNNIMFRYNEENKLQECYLVDLQTPRYGTLAQDLTYFILSSAKLDLKLDNFYEMVRYYHKELSHHLKLLKYGKSIPTLADIHKMLIKSSIWGKYIAKLIMLLSYFMELLKLCCRCFCSMECITCCSGRFYKRC